MVGVVANIWKQPWCFALWIATNTVWAVYDWRIKAYAQSCLFAVYAALAVWGLIVWS